MNTAFLALLLAIAPALLLPQSVYNPDIPKTWDDAALAEWATPVAGLNVRPTHITSKEYYSLTIENLRTYPVYFPGREPEGYWEMLQHIGPKPLIEPEKLHILVENSGGDSPSSAEGAGIALANVRRRLEICYGSGAALDLTFAQDKATAEITIRAVAAGAAR